MVTAGSANNNAVAQQIGSLIDLDRYAEVMGESEAVGNLDLGSTLISKVVHPLLGVILLVNTDGGMAAMIAAGVGS